MDFESHSLQKNLVIFSLLVFLLTGAFFLYSNGVLNAQTGTGCSTGSTDKWRTGATVYYSLSGFNTAQQQQIMNAISTWNTANTGNNSGVNYLPADATHPATHVFQAGTNGAPGQFAHTTWQTVSSTDRTITSATTTFYLTGTFSDGSPIYDPNVIGYDTVFEKAAVHEIGHPMGLDHPTLPQGGTCAQTDGATVMNGFCGTNDRQNNATTSIQACDNNNIRANYPTPTPVPSPTPTPVGRTDLDEDDYALEDNPADCNDLDPQIYPGSTTMCEAMDRNCNDIDDRSEPTPEWCGSPILIDVLGNGFDLTSSSEGVMFNLTGVGAMKWSWTSMLSDDAWLVLDRNSDQVINDGNELFGCITPQTRTPQPNGFIALAEYDKIANGGNMDSKINSDDSIFAELRLWRDENHDGISEPGEQQTLFSVGIASIELRYRESRRTDEHGNRFRYRAKVRNVQGAHVGQWAWDVFLRKHP